MIKCANLSDDPKKPNKLFVKFPKRKSGFAKAEAGFRQKWPTKSWWTYFCRFQTMTEYFKIGKFVSTFGLQGELVLKHNLGKKTSLKGLQAVFIEEKKESFIPWFVESTRIKNEEEVFIKLEGISIKEQATKLAQKQVWLPEADFKKFSSKSSPINMLGYDVVENEKVLGKIEEVIEQPHQLLCRINMNGKEAYIPLHEQTLIKIDKKKAQVIVELPEGLLEIYL